MSETLSPITAFEWPALTQDYRQHPTLLARCNSALPKAKRAELCLLFLVESMARGTVPLLSLVHDSDQDTLSRLLQNLHTVEQGGPAPASHAQLALDIHGHWLDASNHRRALAFALAAAGSYERACVQELLWHALHCAAQFDLRCGQSVMNALATKRSQLASDICQQALLSLPAGDAWDKAAEHVKVYTSTQAHVETLRVLWRQQLAWLRAALKLDGDPQQQPAFPGFALENMP